MDEPASKYLWSDAWLLLAIGLAANRGAASFAAIIASADTIQHAIPTKEEMDGAIGRLNRGGLIRYRSAEVELLAAGLDVLEKASASSRRLLEQQDAIEASLQALPWSATQLSRAARKDEPEVISPAQWDHLMARYR
jgi:hypothetical protein